MIRKLARLDAPLGAVEQIFRDYESWPKWMSGFRDVKIVESSRDCTRIETVQERLGRRLEQVLECRHGPGWLRQRQVEGPFRQWQADWRFFEPPTGSGSVIELQVTLEMGLAGLLVSRRRVFHALDRSFVESTRTAEEQARGLPSRGTHDEAGGLAGLLEGRFEADRVVIEIDGRRYRLVAVD